MADPIIPLLLPPAPLTDNRLYTFDFKQFVEVAPTSSGGLGLSISSASVLASPTSGLSVGSAQISGSKVQVRISSTQAGTYLLTITATTSAGDVLTGYATLDVDKGPTPE
jgi:hypothetical protein